VAVYGALNEPSRRRILDLVRERERSVGDLVEKVGLSQPGVSTHLRILREAGLVEVRPEGKQRWYRLRPEPLGEVAEWLAPYARHLEERFDALERHLEENP
jgi:DNA-binding transcriptional ArsR family regulator